MLAAQRGTCLYSGFSVPLFFYFFNLWHSLMGFGVSPPSPHFTPILSSPVFQQVSSTLTHPSYCHWGVSQQCRNLSVISLWVHPCMATTGIYFPLFLPMDLFISTSLPLYLTLGTAHHRLRKKKKEKRLNNIFILLGFFFLLVWKTEYREKERRDRSTIS